MQNLCVLHILNLSPGRASPTSPLISCPCQVLYNDHSIRKQNSHALLVPPQSLRYLLRFYILSFLRVALGFLGHFRMKAITTISGKSSLWSNEHA